MEGTNTDFFSFPVEVYNVLLAYLPHVGVASLSMTRRDVHSRTAAVTKQDVYWMKRLVEILTPGDLPRTLEHEDIELRGVSSEKVYKDLVRLAGPASWGDYDTFEYMLLNRGDDCLEENDLLFKAIEMDLLGVIEYITGHEFEGEVDYQKIFEYAVDSWLEDVAVYLLNNFHTIDPTYDDNYAFVHAAENDLRVLLERLVLDNRVNPRARNDAALTGANNEEVEEIVRDAIRNR